METLEQKALREQAFAQLEAERDKRSFFTHSELVNFDLGGQRFALIDYSRGIRNPRELGATLSVVSAVDGPYADRWHDDATLSYKYRGGEGDSIEGDNRKLRLALEHGVPIILFEKKQANLYVPIFPVYVVADDPARREFTLSLVQGRWDGISQVERQYREQIVRQRVHQPLFRGMVMRAYERQCTVCTLKHGELLDAAHIIEDREEQGHAAVPNGLSLCKIHHAAYDQDLLGITPDFCVEINRGLLEETDGPMLRYGLQEMHQRPLALPTRTADRPDRDRLEVRYQRFLARR